MQLLCCVFDYIYHVIAKAEAYNSDLLFCCFVLRRPSSRVMSSSMPTVMCVADAWLSYPGVQ